MKNIAERNIPLNIGILLIIVFLIVAILTGIYFVLPGQSFNYLLAVISFVGGVILAGIFFAIGAVISRQNLLIRLLTKPKENK